MSDIRLSSVLLLYPSLPLTSSSDSHPIVLVGAVDAIKMCRGGAQALSSRQAIALVADLGPPRAWSLRAFLVQLGDRTLSIPGAHDLTGRVRRLIACGDVVAVRCGSEGAAGADKALLELRKLVREIERHVRGALTVNGRQYKLVAGDDLARLPDRDRYEVVGQGDAVRVLDVAAQVAGGSGPLPSLLGKAHGKLSRDWRPPFAPDGLVLLRRIPVLAAHATAQVQALSPSALRKLRDEGWVEIVLVDAAMEPVADTDYEVKLPDGQTKHAKTDKKGSARFEGIMPGECLVRFPEAKGPVGLA